MSLNVIHRVQISAWKEGGVVFDKNNFSIALQLLEAGLLPKNAQKQMAKQVALAMKEAQSESPLNAFFQSQEDEKTASAQQNLALKAKGLIDGGESSQRAFQRVAQECSTSIFNVSKQYRTQFSP